MEVQPRQSLRPLISTQITPSKDLQRRKDFHSPSSVTKLALVKDLVSKNIWSSLIVARYINFNIEAKYFMRLILYYGFGRKMNLKYGDTRKVLQSSCLLYFLLSWLGVYLDCCFTGWNITGSISLKNLVC